MVCAKHTETVKHTGSLSNHRGEVWWVSKSSAALWSAAARIYQVCFISTLRAAASLQRADNRRALNCTARLSSCIHSEAAGGSFPVLDLLKRLWWFPFNVLVKWCEQFKTLRQSDIQTTVKETTSKNNNQFVVFGFFYTFSGMSLSL